VVEPILKSPLCYREFIWKGNRYQGIHVRLINRELFEEAQTELQRDGKPKSRKGMLAFAGLLRRGRCGWQMTAEINKGRYVY